MSRLCFCAKRAPTTCLSFYAGDAISGLYVSGDAGAMANVSFQSGASWAYFLTYAGENVYTYSVQYKGSGTISAGTLAVRDKANNVTKWGSDITISSQTGSVRLSRRHRRQRDGRHNHPNGVPFLFHLHHGDRV